MNELPRMGLYCYVQMKASNIMEDYINLARVQCFCLSFHILLGEKVNKFFFSCSVKWILHSTASCMMNTKDVHLFAWFVICLVFYMCNLKCILNATVVWSFLGTLWLPTWPEGGVGWRWKQYCALLHDGVSQDGNRPAYRYTKGTIIWWNIN